MPGRELKHERVSMHEKLRELAISAVAAKAIPEDQIQHLFDSIWSDEELREELAEALILEACQRAVYMIRHEQMTKTKSQTGHARRGLDSLELSAPIIESAFLASWKMRDGRSLGEWTGKELKAEIEIVEAQVKGWTSMGTFYQRLSDAAGSRQISKRVKDEDAADIWREVSGRQSMKGNAA